MPNKRDIKLDKYGLSKYKYRELKNFCLQYREKIAERNSYCGISAVRLTGVPGAGGISDPTFNAAARIEKLDRDILLIEQTAIEVDAILYPYIISNVADGIPYEYMNNPPCGRRQFYEARRKFFYLLSLKK